MNIQGRVLLVLDANILIRAALGQRVKGILLANVARASFYAPDVAYEDAWEYLPGLLARRGIDPGALSSWLRDLQDIVRPLSVEVYGHMRRLALQRIATRDEDDWPVVAAALSLGCPVWTEDQDFFGTGIPTWTTDRVELYLNPDQRL